MLSCPVDPQRINLSCGSCTICQARSKLEYPFEKDLKNSDDLVQAIRKYVTETTGYRCEKTDIDKNPDINVFNGQGELVCRIEAKYLEGWAFMTARRNVGLAPREALVVDLSKLLHYFQCKADDWKAGREIPIYVVWKADRPCSDIGGIAVFQEIDELKRIYDRCGMRRGFERRTVESDFRGGVKMGITGKYHYSIRECEPIEALPERILAL